MEDKHKSRARTTTPTYNATGIKAPRYNVKGIGKLGWSLGGLKGAQVSPRRQSRIISRTASQIYRRSFNGVEQCFRTQNFQRITLYGSAVYAMNYIER